MAYDMSLVRKHFTPGNIVFSSYWGTCDLVVAFEEALRGAWEVTVRHCHSDGTLIEGMEGRIRKHHTYPDKKDLILGSK